MSKPDIVDFGETKEITLPDGKRAKIKAPRLMTIMMIAFDPNDERPEEGSVITLRTKTGKLKELYILKHTDATTLDGSVCSTYQTYKSKKDRDHRYRSTKIRCCGYVLSSRTSHSYLPNKKPTTEQCRKLINFNASSPYLTCYMHRAQEDEVTLRVCSLAATNDKKVAALELSRDKGDGDSMVPIPISADLAATKK